MQAFIFDFDGVIVDSERHWETVEFEFLSGLIDGWTYEAQHKLKGLSMHLVVAHLNDVHGLGMTFDEYHQTILPYVEKIYEQAALMPGTVALIERLQRMNIPIGISSSSNRTWIDSTLERLGIAQHFPVITTADEMPGRGKPFPDVYLKTAERLNINPEGCVALEDSLNGSVAAKEAGMVCIGLRSDLNPEQDLSRCDFIVHSADELKTEKLQGL